MNIASNETSSIDIEAQWQSPEHCHIQITLNEDGLGECTIDYPFDRHDLVYFAQILADLIAQQPGT